MEDKDHLMLQLAGPCAVAAVDGDDLVGQLPGIKQLLAAIKLIAGKDSLQGLDAFCFSLGR